MITMGISGLKMYMLHNHLPHGRGEPAFHLYPTQHT